MRRRVVHRDGAGLQMLSDEKVKIKLKHVFPASGVWRALTMHAENTKNVPFASGIKIVSVLF